LELVEVDDEVLVDVLVLVVVVTNVLPFCSKAPASQLAVLVEAAGRRNVKMQACPAGQFALPLQLVVGAPEQWPVPVHVCPVGLLGQHVCPVGQVEGLGLAVQLAAGASAQTPALTLHASPLAQHVFVAGQEPSGLTLALHAGPETVQCPKPRWSVVTEKLAVASMGGQSIPIAPRSSAGLPASSA